MTGIDIKSWRGYLAAFDAALAGDPGGQDRMCVEFQKATAGHTLGRSTKWTAEALIGAALTWERTHGRLPNSTDWRSTNGGANPGYCAVYAAFGRRGTGKRGATLTPTTDTRTAYPSW